jgi:hypothetical protein
MFNLIEKTSFPLMTFGIVGAALTAIATLAMSIYTCKENFQKNMSFPLYNYGRSQKDITCAEQLVELLSNLISPQPEMPEQEQIMLEEKKGEEKTIEQNTNEPSDLELNEFSSNPSVMDV